MNNIIEIGNMDIKNMIYEINGLQVMLDSDLAKLYRVETKRINEAVSRNKEKFPNRNTWILDDKEMSNLRSQIATSSLNRNNYGGRRYNPRVFTEQGIYMLATILKSKEATKVSLAIMDTFVMMRHYINLNKNSLPHRVLLLEDKVDYNTKRINELFDQFDPKTIMYNHVFFKNDFYDSYSFLLDILKKAKTEIIIIDNYADKEVLDIIKKIGKKTLIISKNIDNKLKEKYEKQYSNVSFINNDSFHDRFIIIDRNRLYHCGSSLKDFGKKCFVISELRDFDINILINKINE